MENASPFHLLITQEDGPTLNGVPVTDAISKNGTWLVAIPVEHVDFEVHWSKAARTISGASTPLPPSAPAEATEPKAEAAAAAETEDIPAQAQESAPVTAPEIPRQGRVTVHSPELKLAAQPAPARVPVEPAEAPKAPAGLPPDEEVRQLHDDGSIADIAEAYGVTEKEVTDAVRRAVLAKGPVSSPPAQQREPLTLEQLDPARRAEFEAMSIVELHIHTNAVRDLNAAGIKNVAQLLGKSPRELGDIPGIGDVYVKSIRSALANEDVVLAQDSIMIKDVTKLPRAIGGLRAEGIETIDQLCALTRRQLGAIHGVGPTEAGNIAVELAARGRSLKPAND